MNRLGHQAGFTLIELLVAMTIFSIISLMALQGMLSVFNTREQTDNESKRLQSVQIAFLNLQRDFDFISTREIRDEYGDSQPALKLIEDGIYQMELSRDGYRNPAQLPRSSLQRIAYRLTENTLHRLQWPVMDRAPDSQTTKRTLLEDVEELTIRVLDDKDEWHNEWPLTTSGHTFPRAIEVTLALKDWGRLSRLFMLPEAD